MMNFNLPQSCQHFDLPRFRPNLPLFDFLQSLRKFIVNGSFAMYNEYDQNYPEVLAVMDPPGGGGDHLVWRSQTVSDGVKNIGSFGEICCSRSIFARVFKV